MKILSFGEVLFDVYPDKSFIGGAPMNFAAHFAKQGGESAMLSALGKDSLGREALRQLSEWGLDTSFITYPEKETGKCLVTLDENQIPSYNLLSDVAYDYISCDGVKGDFDAVYFGTLALRSEYNRNSLSSLLERETFGEVFVDLNIRPPFYCAESILFALEHATIVKISDEEMPTVLKEIGFEESEDCAAVSAALAENFQNLKVIIITLGSKGAFAYDCKQKKTFACNAVKVKAVSTVGAGDSFSASFLYRYLSGEGLDLCLSHAARVAAFVVSRYEAVPEYNADDFVSQTDNNLS